MMARIERLHGIGMHHEVKKFLKTQKDQHWYIEFLSNKFYTTFVAFEDGQVVGIAVMHIALGTAELDYIYVKPEYQGKGVAKQLFFTVEATAQSEGAEGLRLNVTEGNERAINFYKKQGMQRVGAVKNYFSNGKVQEFYWKKI